MSSYRADYGDRLLTLEEYARLPEDPAYRDELSKGRLVRGPDVAFIARDRLTAEAPIGWWPFAPDLAIEVLSPSNTASEIEIKVLEYLDAGARMVWVIDPESRTARSYRGNEARIVREDENLDADDVVPGFSVPLKSIL